MPELPEVETVRRGLERTLLGKTIKDVEVRVKKLFPGDPSFIDWRLRGAKIQAIKRRAKVLLLELSNGWTLAIHLKMTGQLIVKSDQSKTNQAAFVGGHPEKVYEQSLPHLHTHIIIKFTDGTTLYYNDLRKFGWMRLLRSNENSQTSRTKFNAPTVDEFINRLGLGPEPLGEEFTLDYFRRLVQSRKISIKQLLLDQKGIGGIGNIYADEALFYAGIHPQTRASDIKPRALRRLYDGIRQVLELGIEHGGTTMNTYRNVDGGQGRMREHLKVYGREGEPCLVCGTLIKRIKVGQRSSHFCSKCQRLL